MRTMLACIWFVWAVAQAANAQSVGSTSIRDGWVTVVPPEFQGAINNPLKGFRDYKKDGYGLLKRQYIKWNDWRLVSKEAQIPLTDQWQEHTIVFEIKTTFKDETTLRFILPRDVNGTFDLADTRLKRVE
ncbi:MAG: hypothetical protein FJ276_18490 [Planctomycetes bacterium]|nr:hypothetical protein [Planctomycetota bacterium]